MDAKEALTDEQVLEIWHNAPHEDRWNLLKEIVVKDDTKIKKGDTVLCGGNRQFPACYQGIVVGEGIRNITVRIESKHGAFNYKFPREAYVQHFNTEDLKRVMRTYAENKGA